MWNQLAQALLRTLRILMIDAAVIGVGYLGFILNGFLGIIGIFALICGAILLFCVIAEIYERRAEKWKLLKAYGLQIGLAFSIMMTVMSLSHLGLF